MTKIHSNVEIVPKIMKYEITPSNTMTASDSRLHRITAPDDPTEAQRLRLIEDSGVLEFWNEEPDYEGAGDGQNT